MASNRIQSSATPVVLTTSLQTIYTVPSGKAAKDITFDFLNTDTANAIGITLHLVPNGGTASATNQLFSETAPGGLVLASNEWRSVPIDQAIGAGAFIQAKASITAKVSMHCTVTEVS